MESQVNQVLQDAESRKWEDENSMDYAENMG